MIVAPIKRSPNSFHCGQKSGPGLTVTLTVIKLGERDGILVRIA